MTTDEKHDQKISELILDLVFKKAMDDTEENSYTVLLSIPDEDVGNMVELSSTTGIFSMTLYLKKNLTKW